MPTLQPLFKCFRMYLNRSRSAVLEFDEVMMKRWSEENKKLRGGCAQFVDGVCIYSGYFKPEEIQQIELELAKECANKTSQP